MIVLDTSFIIDYFRGVEATYDLVDEEDDVVTTTITYHEILTGLKRKRSKKEEKFFKRFFSEVRILPFDVKAAEESSNIAAKLLAMGREINVLDVLIAGIALANGAEKIITRDSDFEEIAKLSDIEVVFY
ncbi:PilT protein domain protein [Ferroglobus placidus DSM 10642]|uniref:Ribonuclease VapC n=1 Tax=Ferroglobus placidus (strain DSM 10642 / AEDII12DO) TaxID=589924 RepID=D3RXH9_FERPA|nr:PIN domain-containing protein [Ferroglobus placidus]ADC65192.1 PilT protein domain protein [Ferroglobus placidus DSM 10642]